MEKTPNKQKGKIYDDTENLFKGLASGLDENRKEKVREYVERINNGEDKESVLQNQDKGSIFYKAVEEALLEGKAQKTDNAKEQTKDKKATTEKDEAQKIINELEVSLSDNDKKKEDADINIQLKRVGLNADDLKNDKIWQGLSKAEKLLVIEQATQDTLSRVKEIGEKRFQEKNAIKLSWNPLNLRPSFFVKIYNKIGKSYWISKEEKEVINEVELGKQKPDVKKLDTLVKRLSDLKNDFNLNVIENNGKAFIEFATRDKNLSREDKVLIDKYNEQANAFGKMPDSWNNERAAKNTDKMFTKENHEKYLEVKAKYEIERSNLVESKAKQYEASGISRSESKSKAMNDVRNMDYQISILQHTNTNPDALEELNKIKNESSWGRLVNNENIWRSIYMATGYTARGASATLGFIAAPIVSGAIGGIRARRKANNNVNNSFREGTTEETFIERKEQGKKGIFDDKNKNQGLLADVFSGQKVNTKEVAAFVDADSQKQRIDNLINQINNTENNREKASLISRLLSRVEYIELKQQQGLINFGNKNPIGKNYELFKTLSMAYVITTNVNNMGIEMTKEMKDDILQREALLQSVMAKNEVAFGKKIAEYKNNEMLRGAAVAAGFAILGAGIREWIHNDVQNVSHSTNEISSARQHEINEVLIKSHDEVDATAIAKKGDGGIVLARRLQKSLTLKYGSDLSRAPESVKHILNTDADKLAREFEMYKPNQDAESALIHPGDSITEKNGEITFHDKFGNKEINLMKGNDIKPIHNYEGKMVDTDQSGLRIKNTGEESSQLYKVPPQVNPLTGELVDTHTTNLNTIDNPYKVPPQVSPLNEESMSVTSNNNAEEVDTLYKVPKQVNPLNGEPMSQHVNHVIKENTVNLKPYNFDNDEHIVSIRENGESVSMKFIYNENGKIVGTDVGGHFNTGDNPYANEVSIKNLSAFARLDAHKDIMEMAKEAQFLNKLPHNTSEYKYLHEHVVSMQQNILKNYGDVINPDRLEKSVSLTNQLQENLINLNSGTLEKVNINLQENLHHIFPTKKLMETYDYIKENVSAEKLVALGRKEGVADAYKPLISYMDKLEETSGLKPIGKSLINEAESISDYMLRASKKIAEIGKLDEIKF